MAAGTLRQTWRRIRSSQKGKARPRPEGCGVGILRGEIMPQPSGWGGGTA
jgi:hypothetical protein